MGYSKRISRYEDKCVLVLLSCILSLSTSLGTQEQGLVSREPRLFYVSTSSSTTTISTITVCFSTTSVASLTACKKKRRRSILDESIPGADTQNISPQRTELQDTGDFEIEPPEGQRDPKFLLYWITTTTTSTTTMYTQTSTVQSIVCTPTGFFSSCG